VKNKGERSHSCSGCRTTGILLLLLQPLLILSEFLTIVCLRTIYKCFLTLEILPEEVSSNLLINQTALEDLVKWLEVVHCQGEFTFKLEFINLLE
jgi:hypothetical protein